MTIEVEKLVATVRPSNTVLLFGAGSSIPSHAPSVLDLQRRFEQRFHEAAAGYSLAEQTGIIEQRTGNRKDLIAELRLAFKGVRPTGSVLNLPLYDWKSIYTTNYDQIVEDAYARKSREISVYSCNFDFGARSNPNAIQLFKLHGTIEKDISDGHHSRIILTEADYDKTNDFRDQIWNRFKSDLGGSHLIIIGHSLADRDVKDVVDRAQNLNAKQGGGGRITLFSYTRDEGRATLFESRGIEVCFGGLDDFFGGLASRIAPEPADIAITGDPLDAAPKLRPWTTDVGHSKSTAKANVSAMFSGWPATYADIAAGFSFPRTIADRIEGQLTNGETPFAILLGPSGVGKTSAARQVMLGMLGKGFHCWEHRIDQPLIASDWRRVAKGLTEENKQGCLFVDEAHQELSDINELVDYLVSDGQKCLRLIVCSTIGHWRHRVKTPGLHRWGMEHHLSQVQGDEIDRLLRLVNDVPEVRALVETAFSGFSTHERRRRLIQRCDADMFVCLKNIFSTEKLDDIMLREYAGLDTASQEIYRVVAAMEAAGVRVHRQLVIRLLGIRADAIAGLLDRLTDIITEYTEDHRLGIYAWRGRHEVIMSIIANHKYYDAQKKFTLFGHVIDAIQPSYDIEIKTLRGLCDADSGISTIPDRRDQNTLLRKMVSVAPRERVPRHRLLRNLIELGEYDAADTELRLFEKDFRLDGPAARYKIDLAKARALNSIGLMNEDRLVLLDKAREVASTLARRFKDNKSVLSAYCDLGLEIAKYSNDFGAFSAALAALKSAEIITSDSDITRRISRFDTRAAALAKGFEALASEEDLVTD